jgi:hypothetical protein
LMLVGTVWCYKVVTYEFYDSLFIYQLCKFYKEKFLPFGKLLTYIIGEAG